MPMANRRKKRGSTQRHPQSSLSSSASTGPSLVQPPSESQQSVASSKQGRGPGLKPRKKVTSVQIEADQMEMLRALAQQEERTVSALIRLAVRAYLATHYKPEAG